MDRIRAGVMEEWNNGMTYRWERGRRKYST